MYVKYAKFNHISVKHLAELPLSFWRKNNAYEFLEKYLLPFKKFSLGNILNLQIRDILQYILLILLLPFIPILNEVIARNDMKRYLRLSEDKEDIYAQYFEVYDFKIPEHWEKPSYYYLK